MTGYDRIKNMPDTEISKTFWVGMEEAVRIRNSTPEEMILHPEICPDMLGRKGPCRSEQSSCNACRKDYIENEISM